MPAFLLLPGLDGTGRLFSRLVLHLHDASSTHPVAYPVDRVLDLDELADHALAEAPRSGPYVVIAESFSGPVGLRLAARDPTGLAALVLVATFASPPMGRVMRWLVKAGAGFGARLPVPRRAIRSLLVGDDADPAVVTEVRDAIASVEPGVLASRLRLLATVDARPDLTRCTCPILALAASEDRLVRADQMEDFAASEHVALRVLRGPHLLLQTRPDRAAQAIAEFLAPLS